MSNPEGGGSTTNRSYSNKGWGNKQPDTTSNVGNSFNDRNIINNISITVFILLGCVMVGIAFTPLTGIAVFFLMSAISLLAKSICWRMDMHLNIK